MRLRDFLRACASCGMTGVDEGIDSSFRENDREGAGMMGWDTVPN
jgi:hypothetical protein